MTELQKSAYPNVTVHTTGSNNKAIVKAHGKFYLRKGNKLYGKDDGINGYASAKRLERYL